ncbi:MAG TPA: ornithine cyclodeaminase family protein [Gaiellaceae bacterium]|nr:ornithine cyclodeaminase family protein [Gaiellaceae bacterium]
MLVLTRREVEELLDLDKLVDALAAAHAELSSGRASLVPRAGAFVPDAGVLGSMLGYAPSAGLGCKLVTLFPGNRDRPTHQAVIALFEPETGTPAALMDGTYITAMRTAAAAALATKLLARPDARVLAILGTGVQSGSAQEMFPRVRDFTEIRVAGRGEFEEAVRGADVVHATTAAPEPVVRWEWLSPGAHVSSVGSNLEGRSELDPEIVARADVVVVEQRDSAFAPIPAGAPELDPRGRGGVVELGEIVAGSAPGRTSPDQITLYKSVGVAVQDLAAAALVLAAARERGAGTEIELEEIHA